MYRFGLLCLIGVAVALPAPDQLHINVLEPSYNDAILPAIPAPPELAPLAYDPYFTFPRYPIQFQTLVEKKSDEEKPEGQDKPTEEKPEGQGKPTEEKPEKIEEDKDHKVVLVQPKDAFWNNMINYIPWKPWFLGPKAVSGSNFVYPRYPGSSGQYYIIA